MANTYWYDRGFLTEHPLFTGNTENARVKTRDAKLLWDRDFLTRSVTVRFLNSEAMAVCPRTESSKFGCLRHISNLDPEFEIIFGHILNIV